jgi:hypothetical protein
MRLQLAALAVLMTASSPLWAQPAEELPAHPQINPPARSAPELIPPSHSIPAPTPIPPATTGQAPVDRRPEAPQPNAANPRGYVEPPVHNTTPLPRDPHDDR